jgi:hypothetical protein
LNLYIKYHRWCFSNLFRQKPSISSQRGFRMAAR